MRSTCPASRFILAREARGARGFTLIEVLIVIAILLAIGGLVVVNLIPQKEKADIDLQKIQIADIDKAMKMFKLNMNRWPTEDEGLAALTDKSVIQDEGEQSQWRGPYLETPVLQDHWKHDLIYRNPSERGEGLYDIVSMGPDGEEGTADDIANFDLLKGSAGAASPDDGEDVAPPPVDDGG